MEVNATWLMMNPNDLDQLTTTLAEHNNKQFNESINLDVLRQNPAIQVFLSTIYVIIFVVGVFGNVLVCFVVGNNKAMQTVTNLFIANLSISDILLCVLGRHGLLPTSNISIPTQFLWLEINYAA